MTIENGTCTDFIGEQPMNAVYTFAVYIFIRIHTHAHTDKRDEIRAKPRITNVGIELM